MILGDKIFPRRLFMSDKPTERMDWEELGVLGQAVIDILLGFPNGLTTLELKQKVESAGKKCPDATVVYLKGLKEAGWLDAEFSYTKKAWIWSISGKSKKDIRRPKEHF